MIIGAKETQCSNRRVLTIKIKGSWASSKPRIYTVTAIVSSKNPVRSTDRYVLLDCGIESGAFAYIDSPNWIFAGYCFDTAKKLEPALIEWQRYWKARLDHEAANRCPCGSDYIVTTTVFPGGRRKIDLFCAACGVRTIIG